MTRKPTALEHALVAHLVETLLFLDDAPDDVIDQTTAVRRLEDVAYLVRNLSPLDQAVFREAGLSAIGNDARRRELLEALF